MSKANPHYKKISREYIFPIIESKLSELKEKYPNSKILNFGIGDIVKPLKPLLVNAFTNAIQEMGQKPIGYGSSFGYPFLKKAIIDSEYGKYDIKENEVFISEGALNDSVNLLELFDKKNVIAIPNPTYPSYLDNAVMDGRTSSLRKDGTYRGIVLLPCVEENNFLPRPPKKACQIIYLCSPSNPTGVALTRKDYEEWISYAKENNAIIILDAAYESFIRSKDVPRSIYEIKGAKDVAIEIRSFSKSSGFTGLRCAYTIIPETLTTLHKEGKLSLNTLWRQRQNVKTNGVCYPVQRAAEAALTKKGLEETNKDIEDYLQNASHLKQTLLEMGHTSFGGSDCPYIWWKVPKGFTSKTFFDALFEKLHLICIPGTGFGSFGEGYVRLSAFTTKEEVEEFAKRLKTVDFFSK